MWASLARLRTSKFFGWSCFAIALGLLLTVPIVLYGYYKAIQDLGWSRWPLMAFGLGMRGLWIYIFFNRWLVVQDARLEMDGTTVVNGNG